MAQTQKMHVVVIGAGPAGLAVALGLSRLGCTVDVLEKHVDFSVRGSTLGLAKNGSKALRELTKDDDLQNTLLEMGIIMESSGGSMLTWSALHDWLLERVRAQPDRITLHMNTKIVSLDDVTDECSIKVRCEGDVVYEGQLLVAADGVHSQIRSLLGLEPAIWTGKYVWRGGVVVDDKSPELEALLDKGFEPFGFKVFGPTLIAVFNHHPSLPRKLTWVVVSGDPNIQQKSTTPWHLIKPLSNEEDEHFVVIKRLFEHSAPQECTGSNKLSTMEIPSEDGNGWGGRGRVTIIGDAAHAMRPASGQGTSLAFEDCLILCRKVKGHMEQISKSRKGCEHVMQEFENERLPRVRKIWDMEKKVSEASYTSKPITLSDDYTEWMYKGV
mmetsp:Transcript_29104/g.53252  ORF Transcript_29104/g.53252 Transcript_29104/m.53252 type:complete len:384 (-) Transcript_29104:2349-3500(-)